MIEDRITRVLTQNVRAESVVISSLFDLAQERTIILVLTDALNSFSVARFRVPDPLSGHLLVIIL